jgi:hypothetical protein
MGIGVSPEFKLQTALKNQPLYPGHVVYPTENIFRDEQ